MSYVYVRKPSDAPPIQDQHNGAWNRDETWRGTYGHVAAPPIYTVGFYAPNGHFIPESDHNSTEMAAMRVRYLNGGNI